MKVGDSQRDMSDEVVGDVIRMMEGSNLREGDEVRDSRQDVSKRED